MSTHVIPLLKNKVSEYYMTRVHHNSLPLAPRGKDTCLKMITISSSTSQLSLDKEKINRRIIIICVIKDFETDCFMEISFKNHEFRNNPENFHP